MKQKLIPVFLAVTLSTAADASQDNEFTMRLMNINHDGEIHRSTEPARNLEACLAESLAQHWLNDDLESSTVLCSDSQGEWQGMRVCNANECVTTRADVSGSTRWSFE